MSEIDNVAFDNANISPSQATLNLNGQQVQYTLVNTSHGMENLLTIEVDDPLDKDGVSRAVSDRLQSQYWFLSPEYAGQQLRQRFDIEITDGVSVGLYNFQERELTSEELTIVGKTLARYYGSLKDKSSWKLDSIQIEKEDKLNAKSGEPFRGLEVPSQRRFKLFPASFAKGRYRNAIDCSWLEGATIHETTHVTIESKLRELWEQHAETLGWRETDEAQIELPGGFITRRYNQYPSRCVTQYGSYQEDDDRAESIVQYQVNSANLDEERRAIISQVFNFPDADIPVPTIVPYTPELPKVGKVEVSVSKKPDLTSMFRAIGKVKVGKDTPVVPLQDFRQQNQIA